MRTHLFSLDTGLCTYCGASTEDDAMGQRCIARRSTPQEKASKCAVEKRNAWRNLGCDPHNKSSLEMLPASPAAWLSDDQLEACAPAKVTVKEIESAVALANAAPEMFAALELDLVFHSRFFAETSLEAFIAAGYTGTGDGKEMKEWLHNLKVAAYTKAKGQP